MPDTTISLAQRYRDSLAKHNVPAKVIPTGSGIVQIRVACDPKGLKEFFENPPSAAGRTDITSHGKPIIHLEGTASFARASQDMTTLVVQNATHHRVEKMSKTIKEILNYAGLPSLELPPKPEKAEPDPEPEPPAYKDRTLQSVELVHS